MHNQYMKRFIITKLVTIKFQDMYINLFVIRHYAALD